MVEATCGGSAALAPTTWRSAARELVAKMLGEYAHERLLAPEVIEGGSRYCAVGDDAAVVYTFEARRGLLDHWDVRPDSIRCRRGGDFAPVEPQDFVVDVQRQLGLSDELLHTYLEEISGSTYALAWARSHEPHPPAQLVDASAQVIEGAMCAGHPCFAATAGRVGFDLEDHARYAPESGAQCRLVWLAAERTRVVTSSIEDAVGDFDSFVSLQLGDDYPRFVDVLRKRGLRESDFAFLPAHPWQFDNKICTALAPDLATGHLVYLGRSSDVYQPQQSIRTWLNATNPHLGYVKTSLAIINMGFSRGLSAHSMATTPAINAWLCDTLADDQELRPRLQFLREVAAAGYRSPDYEAAGGPKSRNNKLLAALWREPPTQALAPGERALTMAALLHVGAHGGSFFAALVRASGLDATEWLERYFDAYLRPLVHCYVHHGIVFMPHGENVLLICADGVPTRIFLKDLAEEMLVLDRWERVPERLRRIAVHVPPKDRNLAFFMDVFDCFFRFLAAIADRECGLPQAEFWRCVAKVLVSYADAHPEHKETVCREFFPKEFPLACINRMQLRNSQQLLDLADPTSSLQFAGELENPLYPHRPDR